MLGGKKIIEWVIERLKPIEDKFKIILTTTSESSDDELFLISKNYNIDSSVKRFKAYLFSVRSSVAVLAPSSWKLSTFEDLPFLKKMAEKSVNILDIL